MELIRVLAKLRQLKQPIWQTRDVVVLLQMSSTTASKALARLADRGHIVRLRSGLWAFQDQVEPWMLPEYLTAPLPSYISLQSALYHHGMIEQIPGVVYAVSLARTKRFTTPLGVISIHHIAPDFYFGFEVIEPRQIKIATPEKALLDFFYLAPAKTRWFSALPELELPRTFNRKLCKEWLKKIPDPKRRVIVAEKLQAIL